MRVRYAILIGLIESITLGWALGTYNGSVPPPGSDYAAILNWPTGNWVTLFLLLAALWTLCFLCVKRRRLLWWQSLLIAGEILAGLGCAAWLVMQIGKLK